MPLYLCAKRLQCLEVQRHTVILEVPSNDRLQPPAHFGNRVMPASPQFGLHLEEVRSHALAHRQPPHLKPPPLRLPAHVREAEKMEGLRLARTPLLTVRRGEAAELDEPRLVRVQFQTELRESLA